MDLQKTSQRIRALVMEGRAIVREATYYSKKEDFAQHMGAESHSPIWGKDQNKDLTYKSQTTPGKLRLRTSRPQLREIRYTRPPPVWP